LIYAVMALSTVALLSIALWDIFRSHFGSLGRCLAVAFILLAVRCAGLISESPLQ